MYPPVPLLHRKCTIDYKIPDTEITLNKGQRTIIPVMGLHYDSEYYSEPEKFQPERFDDEAKKKIPQFAYLPFGDGPRNCIGEQCKYYLVESLTNRVFFRSSFWFDAK